MTAGPLSLVPAIAAAAMMIAIPAMAQNAPADTDEKSKPTPAEAAGDLPAGTTICGELTRGLDARRLKVGDRVEARTTLAVLSRGVVAIPAGAKIAGHVSEVTARSDKNDKSVVAIVFDELKLKGNIDVSLPLTLQAIGEHPLVEADIPPDVRQHRGLDAPPPQPPGPQHSSSNSNNTAPVAPRIAPTPPKTPDVELGSHSLMLDGSSKGAHGFRDLTLIESKDAAKGAVLISHTKNVKVSDGAEIVLRVIRPPRKFLFLP